MFNSFVKNVHSLQVLFFCSFTHWHFDPVYAGRDENVFSTDPVWYKAYIAVKYVVCMSLDNCVERKESMLFCFNSTLWARWAGGASFLSMSLQVDPSHNPCKLAVGMTFYSIAVPVILVITMQCCWVLAYVKSSRTTKVVEPSLQENSTQTFWIMMVGKTKGETIIYAPISVVHHPKNSTFGLSILQFSFNWSSPALGTLSSSFPSTISLWYV